MEVPINGSSPDCTSVCGVEPEKYWKKDKLSLIVSYINKKTLTTLDPLNSKYLRLTMR